MPNFEHLQILSEGADVWNKWRRNNENVTPDLSRAELSFVNLSGFDLSGADFFKAKLFRADVSNSDVSKSNLIEANLQEANLSEVNFTGANCSIANLSKSILSGSDLDQAIFSYADFSDANFEGAAITNVNFTGANLTGAVFMVADLYNTNFSGAFLQMADFQGCKMGECFFNNVDLSKVNGLENIYHQSPSSVGIDTLYLSKAIIPFEFLRECGVPEDFIRYIPSLVGAEQAVQFYSCFISYSTQDEEFAKRLHSRMQAEKLRVWFAPEDMKGGKKIFEQIENAIRLHDRLLLVLSDDSMKSEWVLTEIREALEAEKKGQSKLFPIGLADYSRIKEWKLIDTDTGKNLAKEIRDYHIPDFSYWKDHDAFERAFTRLLKDLRAEEKKGI